MSVAGKAVGDATAARAYQPVSVVDPTTGQAPSGGASTAVQGSGASGAAASGNPLRIAGVYNGPPPTYTTGQQTDVQTTAEGSLRAHAIGWNFAATDTMSNSLAFFGVFGNATNAGSCPLGAAGFVFNGTNWSRMRGDTNATAVQPSLTASFWNYAAASGGITNTTTAVTIKAAAGAGVRNYIEAIQISWDALGAATEVVIRDGAGGTVLWRMKIGTGSIGSRDVKLGTALRGTAATLMEVVTLTASVTGSVYVNAQGWTGA